MTLVRFNERSSYPVNRFHSANSLMNSYYGHDDSDNSVLTTPAANILEGDTSFSIEIAVPGFSKEAIQIQVENSLLTVSSEQDESKEVEGQRYVRREYNMPSFKRVFRLSRWVDGENVSATFNNGILKIEVPKKAEAINKPAREIKIS